jgi:hypothetical protein
MYKFKTVKGDDRKIQVFYGNRLIGLLDRVKNLSTARYLERPRWIYTVTNPRDGSRTVFESRQKAALALNNFQGE